MRQAQILPLAGLLMALAALAASHSIPRGEAPRSHLLPIETFPRQVAGWSAGPDQAVDKAVFERLKTAKIVDRVYTSGAGQEVELMLVSANRSDDLHNPKICFPNQGWTLSDEQSVPVDGDTGSFMTASRAEDQMDVLYWLTAKAAGQTRALPQELRTLRSYFVGVEGHGLAAGVEADSLMVRLMAPHSNISRQLLLNFARDLKAPLQPLETMAATGHITGLKGRLLAP